MHTETFPHRSCSSQMHVRPSRISLDNIVISTIHEKEIQLDTPELSQRLNRPEVAAYFAGNGHRIAAFRALLDLLSIQHPEWAVRGISGAGSTRRNIMTAYQTDHPKPRLLTVPTRRENATPDRVQMAKTGSKVRCNPDLFNQTFSQ